MWESREAADRRYSAQWRNMIQQKLGAAPETYYETPVIVDNKV